MPAVLLPSNFHDAAEGSLKRPNSTLYKGFRRRPAPFVVPAPQNTAAQRAPTRKLSQSIYMGLYHRHLVLVGQIAIEIT